MLVRLFHRHSLVGRASPRGLAFAGVRLLVGGYWLWEQHWKLPPEFGINQPRGLMFAFREGVEHPVFQTYAEFLREVVVPNFYLFGSLLFVAESLIGLSITLGAFKKLGALAGVAQSLNLLVSQGATPEGPWIYLIFLAGNLFVLLTPCNHVLALDPSLASRLGARAARGSALAHVALRLI